MSKTNVVTFGLIDMKSSNNGAKVSRCWIRLLIQGGVRRRYIGYTRNYDAVRFQKQWLMLDFPSIHRPVCYQWEDEDHCLSRWLISKIMTIMLKELKDLFDYWFKLVMNVSQMSFLDKDVHGFVLVGYP